MRNACFDSTTCNDSACVSGHISLFSIKERPPFMSTAFRNPYENTLCIAKHLFTNCFFDMPRGKNEQNDISSY